MLSDSSSSFPLNNVRICLIAGEFRSNGQSPSEFNRHHDGVALWKASRSRRALLESRKPHLTAQSRLQRTPFKSRPREWSTASESSSVAAELSGRTRLARPVCVTFGTHRFCEILLRKCCALSLHETGGACGGPNLRIYFCSSPRSVLCWPELRFRKTSDMSVA